jgi:hypothetical protein
MQKRPRIEVFLWRWMNAVPEGKISLLKFVKRKVAIGKQDINYR